MAYKNKPRLSKEKKLQLIKDICSLYSEGLYTIDSICESYNLEPRTFRNWVKDTSANNTEISEIYEQAKEDSKKQKLENLKEYTLSAITKKIKGYKLTEVKHSYSVDAKGVKTPTGIFETTKEVVPDTQLLIFLSKNLHSEEFKEKYINENTVTIETINNLTDKELDERLSELSEKQKLPKSIDIIEKAEIIEEIKEDTIAPTNTVEISSEISTDMRITDNHERVDAETPEIEEIEDKLLSEEEMQAYFDKEI